MRVGLLMQRLISNRSLMIGKLSTEESRNEIRNKPGAPKAPAKIIIFCFQAFTLESKRILGDRSWRLRRSMLRPYKSKHHVKDNGKDEKLNRTTSRTTFQSLPGLRRRRDVILPG